MVYVEELVQGFGRQANPKQADRSPDVLVVKYSSTCERSAKLLDDLEHLISITRVPELYVQSNSLISPERML
jgi:hypothetical protein